MPTVKVLVVDDSVLMRQAIVSLLQGIGCVVVGEGANGAEALQMAHRLHPDLVVLDINMPVMGGFEALHLLKKEMPTTEFVFITSKLEPWVREKAVGLGARACLQKDSDLWEELSAVVSQVSPNGRSA